MNPFNALLGFFSVFLIFFIVFVCLLFFLGYIVYVFKNKVFALSIFLIKKTFHKLHCQHIYTHGETKISDKKVFNFHSPFNVKVYVKIRKTYVKNQLSSAVIETKTKLHCRQLGNRVSALLESGCVIPLDLQHNSIRRWNKGDVPDIAAIKASN